MLFGTLQDARDTQILPPGQRSYGGMRIHDWTGLMLSCMHDHMKTISLTDEAYQRLKDWKQEREDSFSKVVLRVVPSNGTFGQLLEKVEDLPPLSRKQAMAMEEVAQYGRDPGSLCVPL